MNFEKIINGLSYQLFCSSYEEIPFESFPHLIFTSPPYNIGSKSPKKLTNRKNGGFDSKSWGAIEHYKDNLPEKEYQDSQKGFLVWASVNVKPTGNIIYNHKERRKNGQLIQPESWFPPTVKLTDKIIWDRGSTHNHCSKYTYDHHEILYRLNKKSYSNFYFCNQDFYWVSDGNRGVGNVWRIPPDRSNKHNAPFPLKLARQIIRMYCPPNGVVCDPYSGSGTTMIAALLEKRSFIGTEILPKYFRYAIKRFQEVKDHDGF